MYINKNSRIVYRVAIGSENVNKRKWVGLSKRLVALFRAKSDRSERSDRRKRTWSILIGLVWVVKKNSKFLLTLIRAIIWVKERNQYSRMWKGFPSVCVVRRPRSGELGAAESGGVERCKQRSACSSAEATAGWGPAECSETGRCEVSHGAFCLCKF